jgi:hypothetical protein
MAECGTLAGYHAHRRRQEDACGPCRGAMAEDKREKRLDAKARAASSMAEAIETEPEVEPGLDPLELARWNARLVKAAMRNASPRDMAANSKRLEELGDLIARLEAERDQTQKKVSPLDEIAKRRAQRLNQTAG